MKKDVRGRKVDRGSGGGGKKLEEEGWGVDVWKGGRECEMREEKEKKGEV